MNCISIAVFPTQTDVCIKRVIEYFYPGERGRIWTDIFVDNPTSANLALRILHAGSLTADDTTEDSWVREHDQEDYCAAVLTQRIVKLHDEQYFPISIDRARRSVRLEQDEYHVWEGSVVNVVGGDRSRDVPFTLWELKPIPPGRSVFRLRLEMRDPTYRRRYADKTSFFAHGEAIVLHNIEDGDLAFYRGPDADRYQEEFAQFKQAHRVPEAFEYLIVAPDGIDLSWEAVALSPLISSRFIRPGPLARTTQWFATDVPRADNWELKADFILEIGTHGGRVTPPEVARQLVSPPR